MTQRERQGWFIVASLFVTLFLVFGSGYDTGGLFFPQLLKHFGWSRAYLSTLGLTISNPATILSASALQLSYPH